jgi:ABC-type multidrug transport system fused ATPase/permease subunit
MLKSLQAALKNLQALGVGKCEAAWLAGTAVGYAVLEGVGVGLLVPMLQYVERGDAAFTQGQPSAIWRAILWLTSTLGLRPTLLVLLSLVFLIILARQCIRYLNQVAVIRTRVCATAKLRQQGIDAFLHADLPFFISEGQGRLLSAITSESERAGTAVAHLFNLWASGTLLVVYFVLLLVLSPAVAPVAVFAMGAVALLVRKLVGKSRELGLRVTSIHDALHTAIGERLAGIRLVKMMRQERAESQRVSGLINRLSDTFVQIGRGQELIEVSVEPLLMLGAFGTLYFAVTSLGLTLASLSVFLFIFLRILPLIKHVHAAWHQLGAHSVSFEHAHKLIEQARSTSVITGGNQVFTGLLDSIEFRDVCFSYPGSGKAGWRLQHLSFHAEKGSLTAIVGRSGAGKSTLLDLLPRLRDPLSGDILLDRIPIQRFDLKSLRSKIGIVDQYPFLFNDTIWNNITYGLSDMTRDRVEAAAEQAHAQRFIQQLPQGYDTIIGDRGIRLSAGQRQRLTLTRMFLQQPEILLLDEPTSALDAETEALVQHALEAQRGKWTVFAIVHRLSTVVRADKILVLDSGQLVEVGNHQQLMAKNGIYARLWRLQFESQTMVPHSA